MMNAKCGAKTRSGKPCQRAPLKGKTRCRLHGGATPSGPESVHFKHGRYATVFRGKLAEKFADATGDHDPLDVLPELGVLRTMLAQLLEKVSGQASVKPAQLQAVSMLTNDVVRAVSSIVKARNETALTAAEVKFIMAGMLQLMEKYVPDPNDRRAFIKDLRGLIPRPDDAAEGGPDVLALSATAPG